MLGRTTVEWSRTTMKTLDSDIITMKSKLKLRFVSCIWHEEQKYIAKRLHRTRLVKSKRTSVKGKLQLKSLKIWKWAILSSLTPFYDEGRQLNAQIEFKLRMGWWSPMVESVWCNDHKSHIKSDSIRGLTN